MGVKLEVRREGRADRPLFRRVVVMDQEGGQTVTPLCRCAHRTFQAAFHCPLSLLAADRHL